MRINQDLIDLLFCYFGVFGTKHIFCSHYMHIFYCHIPFWPTPSHHTTLSLSPQTIFFIKELLNHRADLKERKGPICFPIHLVWSLFHKTAYQKDALYQAFQNSRISKHLDQEPKFIKHHQKRQYFLCKIRESGSTLSSESLLHFQCFIQNW